MWKTQKKLQTKQDICWSL